LTSISDLKKGAIVIQQLQPRMPHRSLVAQLSLFLRALFASLVINRVFQIPSYLVLREFLDFLGDLRLEQIAG